MAFGSDSIRTVIIRFLLLFVSLVSGIINARWLGPKGIGIYALLYMIPQICFRFGNLGFGSSFAFYTAKNNFSANAIFRVSLITSIALSILCTFLLWSIWQTRFSPWRDISPLLFYLGLLGVPLHFLSSFFQRIVSGQLRIKVLNVSEIIKTVSFVMLVVLFVVIFGMNVTGAVLALLLSEALSLFYLAIRLQTKNQKDAILDDDTQFFKLVLEFWRYGRWNYLVMLANFFFEQASVLFLKMFTTNSIVGLFHIGRAGISRIRLIPDTFANILFPYTAASKEQDAIRRTNTLCRNFLLIMVFLSALVGLTIHWIIKLVYGEQFLMAVPVCYALIPSLFFFPVYKFLTIHIAASGSSKLTSKISCSMAPVSILLCLLLIPAYGAVGAGLSISATYGALAILSLIVYVKQTKTHLTNVIIPSWSDRTLYMKIPALLTFIKFKL